MGECKTECCHEGHVQVGGGAAGFISRGKKTWKIPGTGIEVGLLIEPVSKCEVQIEGVFLLDLTKNAVFRNLWPVRVMTSLLEVFNKLTGSNGHISDGAIFSFTIHACESKNGGWTVDSAKAGGGIYAALEVNGESIRERIEKNHTIPKSPAIPGPIK